MSLVILLLTSFYDLGFMKIPEKSRQAPFREARFHFSSTSKPIEEVWIYSGRTNVAQLICLTENFQIFYEMSSMNLERFSLPKPCPGEIKLEMRYSKPDSIRDLAFISQRQVVPPTIICIGEACASESPLHSPSESMKRAIFHPRLMASSLAFDEVINVSIAHSIWTGLAIDEHWLAHPLLGRAVLGLGLNIFGNNPFGARIISALLGLLLPCLLFYLALAFSSDMRIASLAFILCAFDPLRTSIARLALTDLQLTIWSLLVVYSLSRYMISISAKPTDKSLQKPSNKAQWIPRFWLFVAGIGCGLAMSVKLSGSFIMMGALPLALTQAKGESRYMKSFTASLWVALCVMFVFFLVHISLYKGPTSVFDQWFNLTDTKRGLLAKHLWYQEDRYFSSKPWQWILGLGGFDYVSTSEEIFGGFRLNPLITLSGFVGGCYAVFFSKQPQYRLLGAAYFSSYIPFFFISRPLYCYHYITANTLGILLVALALKALNHRFYIEVIFTLAVIAVYGKTYPEILGMQSLSWPK